MKCCTTNHDLPAIKKEDSVSCMKVPGRFALTIVDSSVKISEDTGPAAMVFIKGGSFMMGADNNHASADEYPKHRVHVKNFWIDETEVTNNEFEKFVKATHYVTTAERKPEWNEMKKNFRQVHQNHLTV